MPNGKRKRSTRSLMQLSYHRQRAVAQTGFVPPEMIVEGVSEAIDEIHMDPDNPAVWYEAAITLRAAADALTDMTVEVMSR